MVLLLNEKPYISIVVPVFNTKKYLDKCLTSLKTQTLGNIEIIVIDDGSSDGSQYICDSFAKEDDRFKVIHKDNAGLSAARNDGIDIAQAKYIMFVDSDDWVDPLFCEKSYLAADNNDADIVIFQYSEYGLMKCLKHEAFPKEGLYSSEEVLTSLWQIVGGFAWNKLYRRELFEDICYPVGRYYEDAAVTHRVVYKANRIFLLKEELYHYRRYRAGSISNNRSYNIIRDDILFNRQRIEDLKRWGYDYRAEEEVFALWYVATMGNKREFSTHYLNVLRNSKAFMKNASSWKYKLAFVAFKLSPKLLDIVSIVSQVRICV